MEIVNLRVEAMGIIPKPELKKVEVKGSLKDAVKETRKVWFKDTGFVDATIYERSKLPTNVKFEGPAIVEQQDTTTVLPPETEAERDLYGNIIVRVRR